MKMIDVLAVICWGLFFFLMYGFEKSPRQEEALPLVVIALVISCFMTIIAVTVHWR